MNLANGTQKQIANIATKKSTYQQLNKKNFDFISFMRDSQSCNFSRSGILPQAEPGMVEVDLETAESTEHSSTPRGDAKEEKTTISKL